MAAKSAATTRAVAIKPTRNGRRARVLIDRRYVLGRRVFELVGVFRARVADPDDPITAAAIARAAETTALSESLRARMLRGEAVSPDDVLRLTRTADLLTRRLHLDQRNAKQVPSLADYLAARGDAS